MVSPTVGFLVAALACSSVGPSLPMEVTFRPIGFNGQTPADETISASTEDGIIRVEGTIYLISTCRPLGGTLEAVGVDLMVRLPYAPQAGVNKDCTHEPDFVGYTVVIRELPAASIRLKVIHEYGGDPYGDERVALEETLVVGGTP